MSLMDDMVREVNSQLSEASGQGTVTLRVRPAGAGGLNTTTGALDRDTADYELACTRGRLEQRPGRQGVVVEERTYTFATADLAHGVYPIKSDHVVDGGVTRPVYDVGEGAGGAAVICRTRRERKGT